MSTRAARAHELGAREYSRAPAGPHECEQLSTSSFTAPRPGFPSETVGWLLFWPVRSSPSELVGTKQQRRRTAGSTQRRLRAFTRAHCLPAQVEERLGNVLRLIIHARETGLTEASTEFSAQEPAPWHRVPQRTYPV